MITKLILSIALVFSILCNIVLNVNYKTALDREITILQQVVIDRADWCKRNKENV